MQALFDLVDANKDGVLDEDEIKELQAQLKDVAGNDTLSAREAKKFLKNKNAKDVDKKELFEFLDLLSQSSENILESQVIEKNGQKTIIIKYKDGTTESINPDKTSEISIKGENGETITNYYSEDKKLQKKQILNTDGSQETEQYDENGDLVQSEKVAKGGNPTQTVQYKAGKPQSSVIKNGTTKETYNYDENGNPVLQTKIENEGIPAKEKKTTYSYNDDGTVSENIVEYGKETQRTLKDGKVLSETTKEGNKTTERIYEEDGYTEVSSNENATTTTKYNKENKKTVQTKVINGQEYSVEYDGKGNTKIILQNGESIDALAKNFGCTKQELLEANGGKIRGWAGDELVIPGELQADDKRLQGRQTKEEAIAAYQVVAREIQSVKDEVAERKPISFTNKDYDTYEELAKALFRREGIENPNKRQLQARIEDLQKTNPELKDGELKGKRVTANVAQEMHNRISDKEHSIKESNAKVSNRKNAESIAKEFYQIADDNSGYTSMKKMQELLDTKVTKDNIIDVIDAYDKEKQGDSSIIDTVTSEIMPSGDRKAQTKVLRTIMSKLSEAAREAGVTEEDIQKANEEYEASIKREYESLSGAFRRTNPKDMEKAIDFLRGAIVAKQTGAAADMTDSEAIAQFNSDFAASDKEAQDKYKKAREEEGWTAKVGDTVCGWFGCTTIEDMDKKLGKNAEDVKRLAASASDEAEFKKVYKEVFGIEFDKNKIAARDVALSNYQQAQNLSSTINITNGMLKKSGSMDYNELRNEIKSKFQFDDSIVDNVIQNYADTIGKEATTDAQKKDMLLRFLQDTQDNSKLQYQELTKGKTLEQMDKDLDLLTKSAFGTNDIVKDVIQFNENQQTTEMITDAAFEIAGTVALQFVPGLGQIAAARLAVSAAKWGTKAVKIANYAAKAEKAFAAAKNIQNANKVSQAATQMINAGVATVTVEATSGKDAKTVMKKTLMNMSFAGVGASSSALAPKLMQSFGITNKALANEIAEEIINAAGSYGVTKIAGDDYGTQDAFIDFATGLVMSRISHIKSGKNADSTPIDKNPTPAKPDVIEPTSVKPEPTPVKPDVIEPTSVKPEPTPVKPDVIEPTSVKPEPTPVKPDVIEPTSVKPEPTPVKPDVIEPTSVKPEPTPVEPDIIEPSPVKPKPQGPSAEEIRQRNIAKQEAGISHTNKKINKNEINQDYNALKLDKSSNFVEVSSDTKLVVGNNTVIDFENLPPDLKRKIDLLDDGDFVKIGRNDINPNDNSISREHLIITKQDGKLVIKDTSSNGTRVFDKENFEAYKSLQQMKQNSSIMSQEQYINAEAKFLKNTDNDYVLLNKLMKKLEKTDNVSLNNILVSTNSNNKAILEMFVNNPSGIRKKSSFIGTKQITDKDLGYLMLFNRNHPNTINTLSNPAEVSKLLESTEKALEQAGKMSKEAVSLIETGSFISKNKKVQAQVSTNVLDDIERLVHGEDYIKHYKNTASLTDIARNTAEGDVVSINGTMFVNDSGQMVQLKLSEKRFRQLFPPVGRFATHQGNVGTCYLVATLDRLANTPKGRAKLYQMIGEDANGIYTMTANGNWQKDYFRRFPRNYKHMLDENGLAIIEQGYCKNAKDNMMRKFDASETVIMDIAASGNGYKAVSGLLGCNSTKISYNSEEIMNFIINNANDPNLYIAAGTRHVYGKSDSHVLNGKYDIHQGHEYSIKGYNKETNCVLISNPWHSGAVMEVPMDEFLQQFDMLDIAKI